MKRIIITEDQFRRLCEEAPTLNGGDLKQCPGSEVSATANVSNADGDLEYGKPKDTDHGPGSDLAPQSPYTHGRTIISRGA